MRLGNCHNFHDFRTLAKRRLPAPVFHYIDGAADDEVTHRKNTSAFDKVDLVPNVLTGTNNVDLSTTVLGQKLAMPVYCSPTALQRLFHHRGEHAVARAAEKHQTLFGVSSLGTASIEEIASQYDCPQMYQFYFHKDRGLNSAMLEQAKLAGVPVLTLTVDSTTGGNRERDLRTGFSMPLKLTPSSLLSFAMKPTWGINYVTRERFQLPQLDAHVNMGANSVVTSVADYFTNMLEPSLSWADAAELRSQWSGKFCLKGVMSVQDAKKAVEIGCDGIILSNHGGRQLDGSRTAFDQLPYVADAVGDSIDILIDGGVQRGTHVLKALAYGAKAVGIGRAYLYALAAAGDSGVLRALDLFRAELLRDMQLMGCDSIEKISPYEVEHNIDSAAQLE